MEPGRAGRLPTARALLVVLALAGCTSGTEPDDDGPPMPGSVTYRLSSPLGPEGGLLVEAPADAVVAVGEGGDAFTEVVSRVVGDRIYVAVVHRFSTESLSFDLEVTDTGAPPELTLVQVVGPLDQQRNLAGYLVEVVP